MSEENTVVTNEATPAVIANGADAAESKASYDGAAIRGARKEVSTEQSTTEESAKRPGYNPVDIETATPEQIKERMNYIYRQMKDNEKSSKQSEKMLREYRGLAAQQSQQIEELTKGFNGVVNHLQTKNLDDNEDQLTALMNAAFERGDNKGYLEAQKKLIKLGVDKELIQRKPAPVQQQKQPTKQNSASQLANDASNEGYLSSDEVRLTEAWQNERDENGELLRPWSKDTDNRFAAALRETQGVFSNPRFENMSYEDKLAEVDKRMGVAKRVANQTVSAGGLNGRNKTAKVTLSADIEKMVRATKWGGSKYKTDDERLDAYRKQLQNVKKGAR